MAKTWRPDERSRIAIHIPVALAPLLALLGIGAVIGVALLVRENRALRRETMRLTTAEASAAGQERELEEAIARQHRRLRQAEGELEMMRFQIEAIEMQLDGVDYLSRQLRAELGLPPGSGTWSGETGEVPAQGGAYVPASPDRARLALIQRRLAEGLAELYRLQEYARPSGAMAAEPDGSAEGREAVPAFSEPANWPARGDVTSPFGWRVYRSRPNYHTGIDVALRYGTPVMATADGTVVGSGWQPGYGWSVLVQHGEGYNTLYAHLSEALAQLGERVKPGEIVGLSGSSGNSTGPHLHYEIWKDGQPLDPRPLMDGYRPH